MTSVERSGGGAGDSPRARECYRCDRDVAPPRLFRISVEAPTSFADRYGDAVRFCCVDCAAGLGMLEFADG